MLKAVRRLFIANEVFPVIVYQKKLSSSVCVHKPEFMVGSCACAKCPHHVKTVFKLHLAFRVVCSFNKDSI